MLAATLDAEPVGNRLARVSCLFIQAINYLPNARLCTRQGVGRNIRKLWETSINRGLKAAFRVLLARAT